jgi:flagellar motor switch protein FliM
LPPEKKLEIQSKLADNAVALSTELGKRLIQSGNAEHDMAVTMDQIKSLDHTKKIYSVNQNFQTGSGEVKINVKGGDVNFIVPVLIVIGLIIMGLVYIMNNK